MKSIKQRSIKLFVAILIVSSLLPGQVLAKEQVPSCDSCGGEFSEAPEGVNELSN